MHNFQWLINWFKKHCNGDWEHTYGIRIGTLDNPGWSIKISINETELESKNFTELEINRSEEDWVFCRKKDNPRSPVQALPTKRAYCT